eukprot:gene67385-92314_t
MIALIFRTMEAFKTFDLAYVLSVQPTTELIAIKLYRLAFQQWDTGRASALAYIVLIMVLAITNIYVNGEIAFNRIAIVAVLVVMVIFLAPIYWIASTAFKPRALATTVPPTVLFQPELTPFVKLFTKRVQQAKPVDPETYAAAPWWEKAVYDGGERILKVGDSPQLSAYPDRFANSLIIAISSTLLAV